MDLSNSVGNTDFKKSTCAFSHFVVRRARKLQVCCVVEFCTGEVFTAQCRDSEVIVMTSAVYGRMAVGRCVAEDLGFLGCQNDALAVMDRECSGKTECSMIVSNIKLRTEEDAACKRDLSGYAQISYSCVTGKRNSVHIKLYCQKTPTDPLMLI